MSQTIDPTPESSRQAGSGTLRAADAPLQTLQTLANELEGQPELLLELLRRIEYLHRTIQDGPFRSSLPGDRNALFRLLSEMEHSGGWPYIPRLQLRTFIDLLSNELLSPEGGAEASLETTAAP